MLAFSSRKFAASLAIIIADPWRATLECDGLMSLSFFFWHYRTHQRKKAVSSHRSPKDCRQTQATLECDGLMSLSFFFGIIARIKERKRCRATAVQRSAEQTQVRTLNARRKIWIHQPDSRIVTCPGDYDDFLSPADTPCATIDLLPAAGVKSLYAFERGLPCACGAKSQY